MTGEDVIDEQVITATFNSQLAVGALMIGICVLLHGFGLFGLQRALFAETMKERIENLRPFSIRGAAATTLIVFALLFLHFVEIWLFAFLYDFLQALPNFQEALYFSTISFATIGYSDASIADEWRMVAALEGILGVILLGWSTAFFVRVLGKLEGGGSRSDA
ncbi:ion transporter [Novosphingobium marinum]|uniref:Potassium channel domain-containing protein n=1 Tax=Novosphingobium marinum TaxID=1514948 RepID=A0A7Y9XWT9_9SPHN|nr:potassium channel family protein [Novosphingobium marinum]NYH96012.1 hypothetical protein [Novosphingobium marinum]GGC31739.1 ion transporter [Novosphingobium marinum]